MTATTTVLISDRPIDPDRLAADFRKQTAGSGAIAAFVGQTRAEAGAVKALALEHYAGFTEDAIAAIVDEAVSRWPLHAVSIAHRIGRMAPGDPIVFVAAAADHRRAAFEAVDFLMDYLKSEAPFWKQEVSDAGSRWIEPTDRDRQDIRRWRSAPHSGEQ